MLRIERNHCVFTMSPHHKPVAQISPGETITFETFDCFSNKIKSPTDLFGSVGWGNINPATGPLYVRGAEPGDILRVEILDIALDSQGVMTTAPDMGAIGRYYGEEYTKVIPIRDGCAIFNELSFPVNPMIGVIGVAPANEEIPTGTPGPHGANMDNKKINTGSVVYLPVAVPGALLAMGDLHARMGDGEVALCGIEIAGEVTVKVDVLKGVELPTPMVRTGDIVMTIATENLLDDAARAAAENMFLLVRAATGLDNHHTGMLLSVTGDLCICQIVDPLMTARMEFPVWVLEHYGYKLP